MLLFGFWKDLLLVVSRQGVDAPKLHGWVSFDEVASLVCSHCTQKGKMFELRLGKKQ
jgi:hypothetical protein